MLVLSRKCFPQLLRNPETIRMLGDVEVENASAIMRDQKETIQHTEPDSRNSEEVHCRNRFMMTAKERFPSPACVCFVGSALHPARDRSLRQVKSKLQQFAVNTRRTPVGFSATIWKISSRSSLLMRLRPHPILQPERHDQ
jgi:hypothetical protein